MGSNSIYGVISVQRMVDEEATIEVSLIGTESWQMRFQSIYKAFQFMQQFYSSLPIPGDGKTDLKIYIQTFNMARDPQDIDFGKMIPNH